MGDTYIESATNTNPYYLCVYQAKEGSAEGWGILDFVIGQRIGFIDILMFLLLLICCYNALFRLYVLSLRKSVKEGFGCKRRRLHTIS